MVEKASEIIESDLKAPIVKLLKKKEHVVNVNTVGWEYAKANGWPAGDE